MIDLTIKSIIFDFGGVLINIDYDATIRAFKDLGIDDFEEMYSKASQSNLFDEIEIGGISQQRFINGLLDYLPAGTSPNKVVDAWNAMILDVPRSSIELVKRLKSEGYQIFLLSNTNEIHIEAAYREWDKVADQRPQEIFGHVYLSNEMGMRKPNAEIFEFVCREQSLVPNETLFIDDSIQHIEGAQKIGLNTFHLSSDTSLQELFS